MLTGWTSGTFSGWTGSGCLKKLWFEEKGLAKTETGFSGKKYKHRYIIILYK